ncbi:hypothetical protein ADK58_01280 [Streptomyces sp. XY152]|nr:hypothetical protein ADK58_01280 [Streptomyces sp. XY152]
MVPDRPGARLGARPAPRTRGDGPEMVILPPVTAICSPHPRGWSLSARRWRSPASLLPAPAGMVPRRPGPAPPAPPAPRTRGDWLCSQERTGSTCTRVRAALEALRNRTVHDLGQQGLLPGVQQEPTGRRAAEDRGLSSRSGMPAGTSYRLLPVRRPGLTSDVE